MIVILGLVRWMNWMFWQLKKIWRNKKAWWPGWLKHLVFRTLQAIQDMFLDDHCILKCFLSCVQSARLRVSANRDSRIMSPTHRLPPVKAKKKATKRCYVCGKKTGLATSYQCRLVKMLFCNKNNDYNCYLYSANPQKLSPLQRTTWRRGLAVNSEKHISVYRFMHRDKSVLCSLSQSQTHAHTHAHTLTCTHRANQTGMN